MGLSDKNSKRVVYLLYGLASIGVSYGVILVYTGKMPEDNYFTKKSFIPPPPFIPLPYKDNNDNIKKFQTPNDEIKSIIDEMKSPPK